MRPHRVAGIDRIGEKLALGKVDDEIVAAVASESDLDPAALILDTTTFPFTALTPSAPPSPSPVRFARWIRSRRTEILTVEPVGGAESRAADAAQVERDPAVLDSADAAGEQVLAAHEADDIDGQGYGVNVRGPTPPARCFLGS
jgi:hypothetical protein